MGKPDVEASIRVLVDYQRDVRAWSRGKLTEEERGEARSRLNRNRRNVEKIIQDVGCWKVLSLFPPPAVGGPIIRAANPFDFLMNDFYGMSTFAMIDDMIDAALGALEDPGRMERVVESKDVGTTSAVRVEHLCRRFHPVARQLRLRHGGRPALTIDDEYDVQDLFHGLLKVDFEDVRPEEWTPSYAGKSARLDFLLKREKIVIEVKKTRGSLGSKQVGDELLVDIARYKSHPDCRRLICFVYDPDYLISNPAELEDDLSRDHDGLVVSVIISPRH